MWNTRERSGVWTLVSRSLEHDRSCIIIYLRTLIGKFSLSHTRLRKELPTFIPRRSFPGGINNLQISDSTQQFSGLQITNSHTSTQFRSRSSFNTPHRLQSRFDSAYLDFISRSCVALPNNIQPSFKPALPRSHFCTPSLSVRVVMVCRLHHTTTTTTNPTL